MEDQGNNENLVFRIQKDFMTGLEKAIDFLEQDIDAAERIEDTCTEEWCNTTGEVLRDLSRFLFCINEPQWLAMEDANVVGEHQRRIDALYGRYKGITELMVS